MDASTLMSSAHSSPGNEGISSVVTAMTTREDKQICGAAEHAGMEPEIDERMEEKDSSGIIKQPASLSAATKAEVASDILATVDKTEENVPYEVTELVEICSGGGQDNGDPEDKTGSRKGSMTCEELCARELEEDARFSQDLQHLRSEQFATQSLGQLCLQVISDSTEFYCTQKEPFRSLSGPALDLLVQHLWSSRQIYDPRLLPHLISKKLSKLYVDIHCKDESALYSPATQWTAGDVVKVFTLISQECQLSLTSLELHCMLGLEGEVFFPRPHQLLAMLGCLRSLSQLDLSRATIVGDETLLEVSLTCLKLRVLNVSDNLSVTDRGLSFLCGTAEPPCGGCLSLEQLEVCRTGVTVLGLVTALASLPILRELSHEDVYLALKHFVKATAESHKLRLKKLEISTELTPSQLARLAKVCNILPRATSFNVHYLPDLTPLLNLSNVSEMTLDKMNSSLQQFNTLIIQFSSTLTHITIYETDTMIDISVFGHFCPNLQTLYLESHIESQCMYELQPYSYKKLKTLMLYETGINKFREHNTLLPDAVTFQLLSSKSLSEVCLHLVTLPERVLGLLLNEARERSEVFSSLEELYITDNAFSAEAVMELICLAPSLKEIDVHNCLSADQYWQLRRFAKRNKFKELNFYVHGVRDTEELN